MSFSQPSVNESSGRSPDSRTRTTPSRRTSSTRQTAPSDLYQDELDEGLADDLRRQLDAVERAEARLAAGTYGLSVESGTPIPDERLEALPTAELTADEERTSGD